MFEGPPYRYRFDVEVTTCARGYLTGSQYRTVIIEAPVRLSETTLMSMSKDIGEQTGTGRLPICVLTETNAPFLNLEDSKGFKKIGYWWYHH
jgi:hypothetical protein